MSNLNSPSINELLSELKELSIEKSKEEIQSILRIAEKIDINSKIVLGDDIEKNVNMLILSIHFNIVELFDYLIKKGININDTMNDGMVAVFYAASNSNLYFFNKLIELDCDLKVLDKLDRNILFFCSNNFHSNEPLIKILKKKLKLDINLLSKEKTTPLFQALVSITFYENIDNKKMYEEIAMEKINIMLENNADFKMKVLENESYLSFLNHNAVVRRFSNYSLKMTQFLVEQGLKIEDEPTNNNFKGLYLCCKYNNFPLAQFLIENNVYLDELYDEVENTCLIEAVKNDNVRIVELIIKKISKLPNFDKENFLDVRNTEEKSALFYAAFNNNTKLVKSLIKNSADYKSLTYTEIKDPITDEIIFHYGFNILEVVCYHLNFELIEFFDFLGVKIKNYMRAERMIKEKLKKYENSEELYNILTSPENKYEDFIKEVKKGKVFKYEEETTCSICLDNLAPRKICLLKCGHVFHLSCILNLITTELFFCPICKNDLEVSMVTKMKNFYHISNNKEVNNDLIGSYEEENYNTNNDNNNNNDNNDNNNNDNDNNDNNNSNDSNNNINDNDNDSSSESLYNRRLKKLAASMNNINPRIKKEKGSQKKNRNRNRNKNKNKHKNKHKTKKARSLENIDDELIRDIKKYRKSIKNEIKYF